MDAKNMPGALARTFAALTITAALAAACGSNGEAAPPDTTDTRLDSDMDGADPGGELAWGHCPAPVGPVGDGVFTFIVEPQALFCRRYPEQVDLTRELADKMSFQFVPAEHHWPMDSGSQPISLGFCGVSVDGRRFASQGEGTLLVSRSGESGFDALSYEIEQPIAGDDGSAWTLSFKLSFSAYAASGEVIPTRYAVGARDLLNNVSALGIVSFAVCPGSDCASVEWNERVYLDSCIIEDASRIVTSRAEFEGGGVEVVLRVGEAPASTEPAVLLSGEGELDGTPFAQDDYFRLVYSPHHHHAAMDYAVLFDEPIGSACGVRVLNGPGVMEGEQPTEVALVDCQLQVIESRAVSSSASTVEWL